MARLWTDSPVWVGVAIRWSDGRIEAYELHDLLRVDFIRETDPFDLGDRFIAGLSTIRLNLEARRATVWRPGADAAPQTPQPAIAPAQKAIE